jgi:hypothetical protein
MQKYFSKNSQKGKSLQSKNIVRFSGNATRLEHINVRNKNKGKKG